MPDRPSHDPQDPDSTHDASQSEGINVETFAELVSSAKSVRRQAKEDSAACGCSPMCVRCIAISGRMDEIVEVTRRLLLDVQHIGAAFKFP